MRDSTFTDVVQSTMLIFSDHAAVGRSTFQRVIGAGSVVKAFRNAVLDEINFLECKVKLVEAEGPVIVKNSILHNIPGQVMYAPGETNHFFINNVSIQME